MSEVIGTATIYGTYAAAAAYIADRYGARYTAWLALDVATQKQTLVNAADYLNRQRWIETADTFAERDAIVDADGRPVFQIASYELAALIVDDESVTDPADQSTNIQSVNAGGAGVTFFNPTRPGRGASILPPLLQAWIGGYLASSTTGGPDGGSGQSGSCVNPMSACEQDRRRGPW